MLVRNLLFRSLRCTILALLALGYASSASAQTTFFYEDFGSGAAAFGPSNAYIPLTYRTSCGFSEGVYYMTHGGYANGNMNCLYGMNPASLTDHSGTATGYCAWLNNPTTPSVVYSRTVTVGSASQIKATFFAQNAINPSVSNYNGTPYGLPSIQIRLRDAGTGTLISQSNIYDVPQDGSWHQIDCFANTAASGSVIVEIYSASTVSLGNDFLLDDITVTGISCNAGTQTPTLSTANASNTCPAATVDLGSYVTTATPPGTQLVWSTWNGSSWVPYATPATAGAGVYIAQYWDPVANCYTPTSTAITITINTCAVTTYNLSGNVWDDINGGNVDNSSGSLGNIPGGMYAVLLDNAGNVVANAPVNASTGTYTFTNVTPANYLVALQTGPATVGAAYSAPGTGLPSGWTHTGQCWETSGPCTDILASDGEVTPWVTVSNANVTDVNFGIQPLAPTTFTVSGNVWRDVNGGNVDNSSGSLGNIPAGLLATLYDATTNAAVGNSPVNQSTGTYSFANVSNGTYYVVVSGVLSNGWVYTGQCLEPGYPSSTCTDSNPNDATLYNVVVNNANVTNANFGIEQPPVADAKTTSVSNPGGTTQVTVPTLTGSDPEDGVYNGTSGTNTIKITSLPANGTLYYNGTPVTAGQVIPNYNPSLLTVDPANGAVTVSFTYEEQDAAGQWSPDATVSMQFTAPTTVNVSGTVFDDANGLIDNTVNGTGVGVMGSQLYAYLLDMTPGSPTNGHLINGVMVNANGTYSFANVPANGTYRVRISTNYIAPSSYSSTGDVNPSLPSGWVNTGDNVGAGAGSDGTPDFALDFPVGTVDVVNVDFGADQPPVADNKTAASQVNPGGTTQVTVPTLTGSDPEDGVYNGTSGTNTIKITTLPASGTLYYNGTPVTAGQVIPNYNPSLLTVDPANGAVTVSFTYQEQDAAGQWSPDATVTMPFTAPLTISGNVYDDGNGMNDGFVNGTQISTASGQQLYAVLCSNGTVVATQAIAGGSYSFTNVSANTIYTVVLTTQNPAVGASCATAQLPSPWVYTGETTAVCVPGLSQSYDGKMYALGQVNLTSSIGTGSQTLNMANANVVCVNFGIEQPPVAQAKTLAAANTDFTLVKTIGTQKFQGIPASSSVLTGYNGTGGSPSGTDPEDCVATNSCSTGKTFVIQTINPNTLVYYNGSPVTAGQTIPNFDPTKLEIYGAPGATSVGFTYSLVDANGLVSTPSPYLINVSGAPLPVTLAGFAGKLTEGHAVLSWQTESEENFSHFEVQRSADARQFEYAGVVKSKGSGSSYGFDAGLLTSPTMYYRLKLVDADGKFSYSKVVSVESGMNVLSVYPVPARDVLKIRTGGAGSYSLHDVLGRQVKQGSLELGENVIGLHGLISGTYLLKVETDGRQQTRRIQVLK